MTSHLEKWQASFLSSIQSRTQDHIEGFSDLYRHNNNIPKPLAVYRNNYNFTLKEWLVKSFPITCSFIGDQCFRLTATQYLQHYPLDDDNLFFYGNTFADYIETILTETENFAAVPYLADIAKLDWYLYLSYYAKNRPAFPIDEFAQLDETQQQYVQLLLADDIFVIRSTWPLKTLWQFYHQKINVNEVRQLHKDQGTLVERTGHKPVVNKLNTNELKFAHSIQMGTELSKIDESHAELIPQWIKLGRIVGFKATL